MGRLPLSYVVVASVAGLAACGAPTQVSLVSTTRPVAQGAQHAETSPDAAHAEDPNGERARLPVDDEVVEPDGPAAATKQERALVHIHAPDGSVCSGVVVAPRIVATAHQCVAADLRGARALAPGRDYLVEVASTALTWTARRATFAVVPECRWTELDLAVLVLDQAVDGVEPLAIAAAPGSGGEVKALGFGRCKGRPRGERSGVVQSRASDELVVDVPLCRGDVGGAVVEAAGGSLVGVISHRDDPDGSPLRTASIARLDTSRARALIAQAKLLAAGGAASALANVACR